MTYLHLCGSRQKSIQPHLHHCKLANLQLIVKLAFSAETFTLTASSFQRLNP